MPLGWAAALAQGHRTPFLEVSLPGTSVSPMRPDLDTLQVSGGISFREVLA
jgi:hypothetical protein